MTNMPQYIMANYATVEYWLIIPKCIEIILYWIMAFKITSKKNDPLNRTFATAFVVWTFYTMADLIMWITAANSTTWLFNANRIRDIQILSAVMFAFLIYFAVEIIIHGYKGLSKRRIIIIFIISICFAIAIMLVDKLIIVDGQGNVLPPEQWETVELVIVEPDISLTMVILMLYPLGMFIYSIVILVRLIHTKIDERKIKKKMYYLVIGIVLIPIGILYFTTVLGIEGFYNFWTATAGRLTWMVAPFFIWASQQKN